MKGPFDRQNQGVTDLDWTSSRHTLGRGRTQAAPGNHRHKADEIDGLTGGGGGTGEYLPLSGGTLTGDLFIDKANFELQTEAGNQESDTEDRSIISFAVKESGGSPEFSLMADRYDGYAGVDLTAGSYQIIADINAANEGTIAIKASDYITIQSGDVGGGVRGSFRLEAGVVDIEGNTIAIRGVVTPTAPTDVVNKQYVDGVMAGLRAEIEALKKER